MPFPSNAVGLELEPRQTEISLREILAYSAGLGTDKPVYLDDAQPGGVLALPFQCVALEWPLLLSTRSTLGATLRPDEAVRGVHAVQDSLFHRPITPGDRVITEGCLVSAERIRAGVKCVFRLETKTAGGGDPITTSWSSSIYRDVALEGESAIIAAAPPLPEVELSISEHAQSVTLDVPRGLPHVYSECAAIWNPIHTERAVALAAGLPDIILHGTATWALSGLALLEAHAQNDVRRLKRITARFSGMVIPGEPIIVKHEVVEGTTNTVRFDVFTPNGQAAIRQGVAVFDGA